MAVDGFAPFAAQNTPIRKMSSSSSSSSSTELNGVRAFISKRILGRNDEKTDHAVIVTKALTSRRTVNNFETSKVSDTVVEQAIHAAIHAPCHKMTEPWRFILLGDQTISKISTLNAAEISKKDPVKGAKKQKRWEAIPGWCIITTAKSPDDALQEKEDYAATCCAVQNFMLSLWANGVGTKWTTGPITQTAEFAELCGVDPAVEDVVGCLWYGLASGGLEAVPVPGRKRSIEDVISRRS